MCCNVPAAVWRTSRLVIAVIAAAVVAAGCGSRPDSPASGPSSPAAVAAFAGHGELAFISRGTLWVLDGGTRTLRRVAASGMVPLDPVFSPDGRWLAFLGNSTNPSVQTNPVWLARGDGSSAHKVVPSGSLIGWSPASDVQAADTGNAIRLIEPSGSARTLARPAGFWGAMWSPDGRYLAVATLVWPSAATLAAYGARRGERPARREPIVA